MEIFYSKSKLIKLFLLSVLMVFAALILLTKIFDFLFTDNRSVFSSVSANDVFAAVLGIVCLFAILIFGAGIIIFFSKFFDSEPQLIISLAGIEDKRLNTGMIEWNEIAFVILSKDKYSQFLSVNLHTPEKYYKRLPKYELLLRKINGRKGKNDFSIRFADLEMPIDEVWNYIEENVIKPCEEKGIHLMP